MARITVQDCKNIIRNRFDLVVLTAQRVKQLNAGCEAMYKTSKNEKTHVTALREIGSQLIEVDNLQDNLIKSLSTDGFDITSCSANFSSVEQEDAYSPVAEEVDIGEKIDFDIDDDDDEEEEDDDDADDESESECGKEEFVATHEGLSEYTSEEFDEHEKHVYDDE